MKFVTAGKTTLLIRYTAGSYPWNYIPVVFGSCMDHRVVDGSEVNIALWDVQVMRNMAN